MKRALVLGGGGITGLAWEVGLVAGLAESGVDLAGCADVIGTSAGSLVGSWITCGRDLAEVAHAQASAPTAEAATGAQPDPARMLRAFQRWAAIESYAPEDGREVGAIALEAGANFAETWVAAMGEQIGAEAWSPALRVTAVDVSSGEIALFDAGSGVPLARAVAASCAVPAVFPCVAIGGRRFMDGAVPTGTHAHRALERGAERVLIVAAFDERTPGIGRLMEHERESEVARLREAGLRVAVIRPSEEAADAMGPSALDFTRRGQAVEAGLAQGRAEAPTRALAEWLTP